MTAMHSRKFRRIPKEDLEKLIDSFIEIELVESFQVVKETLTRMGVLKQNVLYQSAHILSKRGKYYILHFKQLFALDGRENTFNESDKNRLYKIIKMLVDWNLVKIVRDSDKELVEKGDSYIHVVKVQDIKDNKVILKKKYNL